MDFDAAQGSTRVSLSEDEDVASVAFAPESSDFAFFAFVIADRDLEDTTDVLPENLDCARRSDVSEDFFALAGLVWASGTFSLLSISISCAGRAAVWGADSVLPALKASTVPNNDEPDEFDRVRLPLALIWSFPRVGRGRFFLFLSKAANGDDICGLLLCADSRVYIYSATQCTL